MFNVSLAETLFQAIEAKNSVNFINLLANLGLDEDKELKKLDIAKDANGRTLLHAAIESGVFDIINAIIGLDLSLKEVNLQNKTPLQIAEEKGLDRVAALLRTKEEWQGQIQTFRLNRVVALMEKAFPNIIPAKNKNKVLFIGATGAGKSTLLNYLNGTEYQLGMTRGGKAYAQRSGGKEEIAKQGNNIYISETLYPQVIQSENLDFVYCDLAGLFDSRGVEKQICAASSTNMLTKLPGDIKGIVVLFDIPGFASTRGQAFKKTALALAEITRKNPELMDSVCFVISKSPMGCQISSQDIIDEYIDPLLRELNGQLDHEEMALYFTLTEMKKRKNQIIAPDITDKGRDRKLIENLLKASPQKKAEKFDFLSHDNSQQCFNEVLLNIAKGFLSRKENISIIIPNKIGVNQQLQRDEQIKIDGWNQEIVQIDQELQGRYDPNAILTEIRNKENQIQENNNAIQKLRAKANEIDNKIIGFSRELGGLNNNDMIELETRKGDFSGNPTEYTLHYKSPYPLDRIQPHYRGYGSLDHKQIRPEMTGARGIDPRDNKEVSYYHNNTDAKNGIYEGKFIASGGLTEVSVTFYAKRCDMHVARINELNGLIAEERRNKNQILKSLLGFNSLGFSRLFS